VAVDHTQHERRRHGSIDRIPPSAEGIQTSLSGQWLHRGDHSAGARGFRGRSPRRFRQRMTHLRHQERKQATADNATDHRISFQKVNI
jgi:hypothetical protein